MRPHHKQCDARAQCSKTPVAEDKLRCDRKTDRRGDRAERDIARCEPQHSKNAPADKRDAPVEKQQQRAAAQNALAALEAVKHRKHVSDDAEQCAEILADHPPAKKVSQKIAAEAHRADGLDHIERDDHGRALCTIIAVKVRQPRVAAAVAAHIVVVDEMRRGDRSVDAAEKIRQHCNKNRQAKRHDSRDAHRINVFHQSSLSPFSRIDMMTGVPSSPKTLRMQFSR